MYLFTWWLFLGKFQTPSVICSLCDLTADADPNIRAVAAIGLGRAGNLYTSSFPAMLTSCLRLKCLRFSCLYFIEGVDDESPAHWHAYRNALRYWAPYQAVTLAPAIACWITRWLFWYLHFIHQIGKGTKRVQDSLMKLLGDEDRLVRQSACLAQALLKETKAVQKISDLWYVVSCAVLAWGNEID